MPLTKERRGWCPVKINMPTYNRLDRRKLVENESFDSIIGRVLNDLERFERLEKTWPELKEKMDSQRGLNHG